MLPAKWPAPSHAACTSRTAPSDHSALAPAEQTPVKIAVVGASRFAERMVPQFVTLLRWQDALIVMVAVLTMSLLAAYLPIRKVLSLDPLRLFKA